MDEIKEAVGTDGYVVEVSTSDKKIRWIDGKTKFESQYR